MLLRARQHQIVAIIAPDISKIKLPDYVPVREVQLGPGRPGLWISHE